MQDVKVKALWVCLLVAAIVGLSIGVGVAAYRGMVVYGPHLKSEPANINIADPDSIDYVVNLTDPAKMQEWFDGHIIGVETFRGAARHIMNNTNSSFFAFNHIKVKLQMRALNYFYDVLNNIWVYDFVQVGSFRCNSKEYVDPNNDLWLWYEDFNTYYIISIKD